MHMGSIFDFMEKKICPSVLGLYLVKRPFLVKKVQKLTNIFFHKIKNAPHMQLL